MYSTRRHISSKSTISKLPLQKPSLIVAKYDIHKSYLVILEMRDLVYHTVQHNGPVPYPPTDEEMSERGGGG